MGAAAVPVISLVGGALGIGSGFVSARRQKKVIEKETEKAEARQEELQNQQVQREAMLQIQSQQKARRDSQRLRRLSAFGRGGNIRTSPVGLTGGGEYPQKTLIGS